ncbi:MAG: NADH-quinone oxidoreductase subunit M [Proteobacteria bacterium]|jgi:NADH-quinone oxidoreductase subunit M|nr:NADH-quinone oxidoreductase subunit M [Pseudomonadota bacterium]MBW2625167.1 NADH-quinone oxidoreductase subunit M [Deltaproteobacteria bacterium]
MLPDHLLSWMIFFPLIGAGLILLVPKRYPTLMKLIAVAATIPPLWWAANLYVQFDRWGTGFQYVEKVPWIKAFNIHYSLGIDGISVPMVLLTALLSFLCVIASWNINEHVRGYFALFLLLNTSMVGVFCALDFFLFYVFWELMLLPMYFLIGVWGGPNKEYAAIKFFLFTLVGSVLMLIVMLVFYFGSVEPTTGLHSFDLTILADQAVHQDLLKDTTIRWLSYLGLFIGFAIKIPLVPFHTWLPDAHVEAPTAISVILAGVLLKMGTYGILRISYPVLPDMARAFALYAAIFGLVSIIYGALCAMAQTDLKKLIAYSSISHMGFVMLGMSVFSNTTAINGAVLQMFNHGTVTAMLFLLVGVIYDRAHIRDIDGFGGLAKTMPIYAGYTGLAFFAGLGLPGLSSFISEALVLVGSFQQYKIITITATTGIILTAAYFLWTMQRMFLGPQNMKYAKLPDISLREAFTLTPLALIVILLGFYPMPVLDLIGTTLKHTVAMVVG